MLDGQCEMEPRMKILQTSKKSWIMFIEYLFD